MSKKQIGYLFITLNVMELSLLPIVSSIGASSIGTIPLLFLTFLTATIVSLCLVVYKRRMGSLIDLISNRKALFLMCIAGLLNYAVVQLFITLGVLGTNPVVAALITKSWPIIFAVMLPFATRTSLKPAQLLALLFGLFAVYLLVSQGQLIPNGAIPFSAAILFLIISAFSTATSNIIIKTHNYDLYAQLFVFNLASFLLFAIITGGGGYSSSLLHINTYGLISFLFLGIVVYSIGAFMYFYAFKMLNPVFVTNMGYITPFLTIIFSALILKTMIYGYYLYSLAFLLVALVIQQRFAATPQSMNISALPNLSIFDVTGAFAGSSTPIISGYIRGRGRALALKLSGRRASGLELDQADYPDCILFTDQKPHPEVTGPEMEFVNDIMGKKEDEVILIGIGELQKIEEAFSKILVY